MKKILKNRKGFTLIELLAVIVILAILVMVAIPAITKILTDARKGTYADTALNAISSVRQDFLINGNGQDQTYTKDQINAVLEKQLNSPFSADIVDAKILIDENGGSFTYYMCMYDSAGNGFGASTYVPENELDKDEIKLGTSNKTNTACNNSSVPETQSGENNGG